MTSHDWDKHCDTLLLEEPLYHEQLLIMQEFEETRNAALKREGAKEALGELKLFLLVSGNDERCKEEFWGLKWSIDAINRRLTNLEVTQEGGVL